VVLLAIQINNQDAIPAKGHMLSKMDGARSFPGSAFEISESDNCKSFSSLRVALGLKPPITTRPS